MAALLSRTTESWPGIHLLLTHGCEAGGETIAEHLSVQSAPQSG